MPRFAEGRSQWQFGVQASSSILENFKKRTKMISYKRQLVFLTDDAQRPAFHEAIETTGDCYFGPCPESLVRILTVPLNPHLACLACGPAPLGILTDMATN